MILNDQMSLLRISAFLVIGLLLVCPASAWAQTVVATVTVGVGIEHVAVNPMTNKIYTANIVIDGTTDSTTTVTDPNAISNGPVAVNPVTNKIYIANRGNAQSGGSNPGSVTVIDGATNSTTTVTDPNAISPVDVAVNPMTNKIYVANFLSSNVTVIDGGTNSTTTITDSNATGLAVYAVAVNQVTNKIYALNNNTDRLGSNPGSVTVIDGATNSTTTVTDPNAISPFAVAVNPATNKIYVANEGGYPGPNHGNVTVIDGATNSTTTVTDPNALAPQAVTVDPVTNKIYVANINDSALSQNGGVTVIDGATNSFVTVKDPNAIGPVAVAVDPATNKIYVANAGSLVFSGSNPGCVTVIDGATNSATTVIDPKAIAPFAVAVDSATGKVYVANVNSGNVTVIDGSTVAFTLSVIDTGSGAGTVTSNPPSINCPSTCSASFASGTMIALTASPAAGSIFTAWSGACSGTAACSVTMNAAESVTATFDTAPPDFSLSPASASLTVLPAGQVTDAITLAPQNGPFATAIQLTCTVTGSAPAPTCSLNPTSVTPGANSATSTLTLAAPAAPAMLQPTIHRQLNYLYAAWLPLPGIVVIGIGFASRKHRDRRRNLWLFTGSLIVLFAVLAGCGGGSNGPPPPQNYTVTVTGTSGTIQHTTQVTVTVQ
jgi:DNA-binding beta-propeller fold protein YncE